MIAIALVEPEIPQNTGNIARLSVAVGAELFLVGPLGFELSDRTVRRAGLDYWKDVKLRIFDNLEEFLNGVSGRRLVGVDPRGAIRYTDFSYTDSDILVFGKESVGLGWLPEKSVYIPMKPNCRSLNLANAVAIVAFEAMRGSPDLVKRSGQPCWGGTLSD